MSANDWAVDAVIQFVRSPMWTAPVNNFIDDHCICFADDDGEELKLEYTVIFQKFQQLIDALLSSFIEELGVPAEEVIAGVKARMVVEQSHTRDRFVTEFMEYITCLDDFRSFKKVMEQRNVQLELEAAKALQRATAARQQQHQHGSSASPEATMADSIEERDLRLAIEASLAEIEVGKRQAQLEDAELQKALALSVAAEEERVRAQREYLEECERRTAAREEALRLKREQELLEAQKQARIQQLHEEALTKRIENIQRATAPKDDEPLSPEARVPASPPQGLPTSTPAPGVEQPQAQAAPAPDVLRLSTTLSEGAAPLDSGLAPLGSRKAAFGSFKALPSIASNPNAQPTFAQLHKDVVSAAPPRPSNNPAPTQVQVAKGEPTPEQVEERARQMRQLREQLAATKKAERNAELQSFKSNVTQQRGQQPAGADSSSAPSSSSIDDETRKITVEIARRFREDLIGETRRQ